ncbi:dihydrodipicolinate synthase family protein [Ferrovibrio sp.]|uniref:dihydrodipicolinate synthase family protein n=1 Tax=Ferrovibrio sp. TaxID=1917215 RepID=UPI003D0A06E5
MKTSPVTPADLSRSVIAVPPLARNGDFSLNEAANTALIRHLEGGGVRTLMYGGNANFYHIGLSEYERVLDFLEAAAGPDTWLLPSFGPDYGRLIDQARMLRSRRLPTAMALPMTFPMTPAGVALALRRAAEALGKPIVVYIKSDNYIDPAELGRLDRDGLLVSVKYAVVRADTLADDYLRRILQQVDKSKVVSGIGERPAIQHLRHFGLASFTSGSVCLSPRGSMAILRAIQRGDDAAAEALRAQFMPLEDLRDEINPIRVLHDAVSLGGVADTGPMLPMLTGLNEAEAARVAPAARALKAWDDELGAARAAE